MDILLHIGLNKCGSTFLQNALDHGRSTLKAVDTWYPAQDGPPCQYGLSKAYGFGPEAFEITEQSLDQLIAQADAEGCTKLILSSEYFSLERPRAAETLWRDLTSKARSVQVVVFSRDVFSWVRSLFNQYVKAVEGPGQLENLNAFIDQTLANRAIDVATRIATWRDLVPPKAFRHYRLVEGEDRHAALGVFETFAGLNLELEAPPATNASIDAAALYRVGQLRRRLPTDERDAEITRLLTGGASPYPAPDGFLHICPTRRARLIREIVAPYTAIPSLALPGQTITASAA